MFRRPRLTYANVAATAALVLATTGTATAATLVVSSNSQVGPATIAGAAAAAGTTNNVIPGSIASADLKPGAVTASRLASTIGTRASGLVADGAGKRLKNAAVRELNPGAICIAPLNGAWAAATANVVATPDFSRDSTSQLGQAVVEISSEGTGCNADELLIRTFNRRFVTKADGTLSAPMEQSSQGFSFAIS